jgi:hypothetical protein
VVEGNVGGDGVCRCRACVEQGRMDLIPIQAHCIRSLLKENSELMERNVQLMKGGEWENLVIL